MTRATRPDRYDRTTLLQDVDALQPPVTDACRACVAKLGTMLDELCLDQPRVERFEGRVLLAWAFGGRATNVTIGDNGAIGLWIGGASLALTLTTCESHASLILAQAVEVEKAAGLALKRAMQQEPETRPVVVPRQLRNQGRPPGEVLDLKCDQCGKPFERKAHQVRSQTVFCGRKCMKLYSQRKMRESLLRSKAERGIKVRLGARR